MPHLQPKLILAVLVMLAISVASGLFFLAGNAPRDWSLHWENPRTILRGTSDQAYAASATSHGWDVAWMSNSGKLYLSRFARTGHPLGAPVLLHGTPVTLALGVAGPTQVVAWRYDTNGGSGLRAALVRPGQPPLYRTLASGPWPLEHPWVFAAGRRVGIVFSWQRTGIYDVYLSYIAPNGQVTPPVRLTHVAQYAFDPRAVRTPDGDVDLLYMDACCNGSTYHLQYARYSAAGRLRSRPLRLADIDIGGEGQGSTPDIWGIALRTAGTRVWAAWTGDQGLGLAAMQGGREVVPPHVLVPMVSTDTIALALHGNEREVVWDQQESQGVNLSTLSFDAAGQPLQGVDRVTFEPAIDAEPIPVTLGGHPAVIWQATPAQSATSVIEVSRFTPKARPAPSLWAKFGLGLANPLGNLLLLLVAGIVVGLLLTVGNILSVFALTVIYFLVALVVRTRWKWYLYPAVLAAILYVLLDRMAAPSPPVFFLSALNGSAALVALVGSATFALIFGIILLRRVEDLYRAGLMAFAALYFVAFLQALILVQGQIARI